MIQTVQLIMLAENFLFQIFTRMTPWIFDVHFFIVQNLNLNYIILNDCRWSWSILIIIFNFSTCFMFFRFDLVVILFQFIVFWLMKIKFGKFFLSFIFWHSLHLFTRYFIIKAFCRQFWRHHVCFNDVWKLSILLFFTRTCWTIIIFVRHLDIRFDIFLHCLLIVIDFV